MGILTVLAKQHRGAKVIWLCQCDCQNFTRALTSDLNSGQQKSCGCLRRETTSRLNVMKRMPHGEAQFRLLERAYKHRATKKGWVWELTRDETRVLMQGNCFYCGTTPAQVRQSAYGKWGDFIYNGIDRKDSDEGYTKENAVPCCKLCNMAKMKLTVAQFLDLVERIYNEQARKVHNGETAIGVEGLRAT